MPKAKAKPKPPPAAIARLERAVLSAVLAWHRASHGPDPDGPDELESEMDAAERMTDAIDEWVKERGGWHGAEA